MTTNNHSTQTQDATPPIGTLTAQESDSWDLVIRPKTGWFDLHLADLWRCRDLIGMFVWRDFVSNFKQTILGPLWFIIQPLLTTIIFTVVFGNIARLGTDGLPAILFYMSGVIGWNYFADCLNITSNTFIANANIFGKVYFPRMAVPLSIVISNLYKYAIQFVLFLGFWSYYYVKSTTIHPNAVLLLTPLLILIMAGFGLGCGIIISSLTTKYRDLRFLVGFAVQLAMYATPVIYPLSKLQGSRFLWLVLINPMTSVIETFRYGFLGAGVFRPEYLALSTGVTAFVLSAGIILFTHTEKTFMDTV
jgi:lipopolysaccharide transport system permease protein